MAAGGALLGFFWAAVDACYTGHSPGFSAAATFAKPSQVPIPSTWRLSVNPAVNRGGRDAIVRIGDRSFHPPGNLIGRVIISQALFDALRNLRSIHFSHQLAVAAPIKSFSRRDNRTIQAAMTIMLDFSGDRTFGARQRPRNLAAGMAVPPQIRYSLAFFHAKVTCHRWTPFEWRR